MKRILYLFLATLLGLLLSFIVHALTEILILQYAIRMHRIIHWHAFLNSSCALPTILIISLPIIGLLLGNFLGRWWWRIVYLEHRHWRFKKTADIQ